jgi:predicted ribonucleotide reductase-associated flavodoxin
MRFREGSTVTILVAFDSESGNTREISREIMAALHEADQTARATLIEYRIDPAAPLAADLQPDLAFIGTYTWGRGSVPAKAREFAASWKPACPVAVFGSGDTQWGDGYFCAAADKLAGQFASPFPVFKQEQMPNTRQREQIRAWAAQVATQALGQARQQDNRNGAGL